MPAVLTAAEAAEHDGPVGLRVLLRCGQSIATLSGCLTPRAVDARVFHRIESANLLLAKTGGTSMRYFKLVSWFWHMR